MVEVRASERLEIQPKVIINYEAVFDDCLQPQTSAYISDEQSGRRVFPMRTQLDTGSSLQSTGKVLGQGAKPTKACL